MIVSNEVQPRRTGPVAYPCIACGSLVGFEQVYCAGCLRAATDHQAREHRDPDAVIERVWLRDQIERAA
jgi:predicted Fe-S protein YdhL (DUF1289 family)